MKSMTTVLALTIGIAFATIAADCRTCATPCPHPVPTIEEDAESPVVEDTGIEDTGYEPGDEQCQNTCILECQDNSQCLTDCLATCVVGPG